MLRYGRLTHGSGFGGRGLGIGDSDHLEDAYILPRVQAEMLWAVIVDSYPTLREPLESAGTPVTNAGRASSGQK